MASLIIVGCSAHGRVVLDIFRASGFEVIAGWIDDAAHFQGTEVEGLPVLGKIADLPVLRDRLGPLQLVAAIGDNFTRAQVSRRILDQVPDCQLAVAIHPNAIVALGCVLGPGTVVAAGAIINPGVKIGEGCIINTRVSVDHDCTVEAYASLAPGAVVGGDAVIGEGAAIGIGAVVANGVKIGSQSVIGAGAVVVRSIPSDVIAYGIPARVIRSRQPDERYLTSHLSR